MAKINVVSQDFESIKNGLTSLIGKEVSLTIREKTKVLHKKAIITIVSDNLFCVDAKIGKYNTCNFSYTFIDLKTNKVVIEEMDFLKDE